MATRKLSRTTVFWIGLLLVLLVALNVIAFLVYKQADPEVNFWVQFRNYLESAAFKVITASLVLPIILFVLESRFKIVQTIKQNQLIRELKEEEELREKRWECIKQTSKIWNQLWDLISEVIYFKKDTDKGTTIEDLLIRLRNLTTSAEDVTNMWSHRFPELPDKYFQSFKVFFNTESDSAETVAWCIRHGNDEEEIRKMQDALRRIVESINYLVHHTLIDVLKHSMRLLELRETNVSSDQQKEIESLIDTGAAHLKMWADAIQIAENEHNTAFSFIDTEDVKSLRDKYKRLKKWMLKNPGKYPDENYTKYNNFRRLFYKVPHEQVGPCFSKEFVMYLANWLSLEHERAKLLHRVTGQQSSG